MRASHCHVLIIRTCRPDCRTQEQSSKSARQTQTSAGMNANPCMLHAPSLPTSSNSAAARWRLCPAGMHVSVAHLISCRRLPTALCSTGISCPAVALRGALSFSQLNLETEAPFCLPKHRDSWAHGSDGIALPKLFHHVDPCLPRRPHQALQKRLRYPFPRLRVRMLPAA